jgi:proteasome assembly chaperone 2
LQKNFASWAAHEGVKEVVILSGLDSGKVQRSETLVPQIQYISTAKEDGSDERCEQLGWKRLQHYSPSSEAWKLLDHQAASTDESPSEDIALTDDMYFPRQPFASLLACCKVQGLKVVCVLCFCAEGDNVPDAFLIADGLHRFLNQGKRELQGAGVTWKIPLSWTTVYGPPPDDTMFS